MKLQIIFVALCITSSLAMRRVQQVPLDKNPFVKDLLESLKGTPLGSSISTLITLKMRTGQAFAYDSLFDAFDELIKWLKEQRDFATLSMGERTKKNTKLTGEWGVIAASKKKFITMSNGTLFTDRAYVDGKNTALTAAGETATGLATLMTTLVKTRTTNNKQYNKDRPRIVAAIDGCNAALACLEDLEASEAAGESGFIQVAEQHETLMQHMQEAADSLKEVESFKKENRILSALLSLAQNTDQGALQKVMTLITDLRKQLVDRLAEIDDIEKQEVITFTKKAAGLQEQIDENDEEIKDLKKLILAKQAKIDALQKEVDTAQERLDTMTGYLNAENDAYAKYVVGYKARLLKIEEELALLAKAETVLSQNGITRG